MFSCCRRRQIQINPCKSVLPTEGAVSFSEQSRTADTSTAIRPAPAEHLQTPQAQTKLRLRSWMDPDHLHLIVFIFVIQGKKKRRNPFFFGYPKAGTYLLKH